MHAADQSLSGHQQPERRHRLEIPVTDSAAAQEEPCADDQDPEDGGNRGVLMHRRGERVRSLEVQAMDDLPVNPPECGPAAVAAVPAKIVSAPNGRSARTDQTATRSSERGRDPGSNVLRHARATAATRMSSESPKWAITNPGAR